MLALIVHDVSCSIPARFVERCGQEQSLPKTVGLQKLTSYFKTLISIQYAGRIEKDSPKVVSNCLYVCTSLNCLLHSFKYFIISVHRSTARGIMQTAYFGLDLQTAALYTAFFWLVRPKIINGSIYYYIDVVNKINPNFVTSFLL